MFIIIPPLLYSSHKILQFVGSSFWSGGKFVFLKIETINCYGVKKWVNDKTKFLVKVLNCFLVWKCELLKNRYLVFEIIVFKLIWSRKRHMRRISWQHQLSRAYVAADYCNLFTYFLFLLIFYVWICFTCLFSINSVNILMYSYVA